LEQLAPEYGGQRRRLRVTKLRESTFRDGYHDFQIRTGGLRVFPRLVAAEHHRHTLFRQETVSSNVPELDSLLGGGLDRGTATLVLGHAGVGKSTLTAQFATAAMRRGERVAFFIFDEVPNTVVIRGESLGMEVKRHMDEKRMFLRQVDPAEMAPGQFAAMVRDAVTELGATMVVIDSVNGYQSAMPEEHFLSAHLHELLAYLNQERIITMLVMTQSGLLDSRTPIDISYLADTVIMLRNFEAAGQLRQAISVVKRRTGPHERTIREMTIGETGVRVGRPLSEFHGIMSGHLTYTGAGRMLSEQYDGPAPVIDGHGTS
jgi:circadian clock protein KaiC